MWTWLRFGRFRSHPALAVDSAALCERGLVRLDNQDHVLARRGRFTYLVADGMGGGDGGAKASAIVCAAVSRAVARRTAFAERVSRLDAALAAANAEIRAYAAAAGYTRQMATTAALLALDGARGKEAVIGYIGDSRIYRLRAGEFRQLTRDHTVAGELGSLAPNRAVAEGLRNRSLALSHVLTRAVGVLPEITPEWRRLDLRRGDTFLLCSDGVYDMVNEATLREELARGGTARETVARLARRVVEGGAGDNYSIIVVRIGGRG